MYVIKWTLLGSSIQQLLQSSETTIFQAQIMLSPTGLEPKLDPIFDVAVVMDALAQHGVAASAGLAAARLAVIAVVLSVVHISGSRLNPAVVLAPGEQLLLQRRDPIPLFQNPWIHLIQQLSSPAAAISATFPRFQRHELFRARKNQAGFERPIYSPRAACHAPHPRFREQHSFVYSKIKTSKFSSSSSILIHKSTKTAENNRIAIIISPRAGSSKILPFELVTDGGTGSNVVSQRHSDPAEPPDETKHHLWHPGLPKIKAVHVPLVKKVIAEFFGTFILIFTVLSTIIMDEQHKGVESLLGIATSAGLAVTVLVLSLIHISGCHLNPAVSIAMAVFGHLPLAHLLPYMAAQVLGSIGASFAVKGLYHPVNPGIVTVPKVGTVEAFFLEFITTFILLLIITALATDPNAVKELVAVAVGATIMMNALVAGPSTGASMNPARTIGPAIATGRYTQIWVYLVATPLGAIAGTGAYYAIKL
ncbi:hypothetical protein GUJ93_ZPchr0008g12579 [Zizania palustris]|uniref:Uncharacterized protein n=1 Tax=Zizania palustris TaxID=103762 RepID=A0A8J5RIP7_ZIZPA|nr:hypothetical protein GUJ93_ZPchr0008g12579 [Zizania palustris]